MRTTVTVDDDVLLAARDRARRERRSVGAVLSQLAREGLSGGVDIGGPSLDLHGFAPLPRRGMPVSNALVDRLREDEPD